MSDLGAPLDPSVATCPDCQEDLCQCYGPLTPAEAIHDFLPPGHPDYSLQQKEEIPEDSSSGENENPEEEQEEDLQASEEQSSSEETCSLEEFRQAMDTLRSPPEPVREASFMRPYVKFSNWLSRPDYKPVYDFLAKQMPLIEFDWILEHADDCWEEIPSMRPIIRKLQAFLYDYYLKMQELDRYGQQGTSS